MSEQTAKSSLGNSTFSSHQAAAGNGFLDHLFPKSEGEGPQLKKTAPCSPQQGCTPATERGHASRAASPASLHWWRGWMSNSLLGNPTLSGESQTLWHPYRISETPDKLMNIYIVVWFLVYILSNETPTESNTQMVQETKTMT